MARLAQRTYAVVLNDVPPRRLGSELLMASFARRSFGALNVPVWSGQITHRTDPATSRHDGGCIDEGGMEQRLAAEKIGALWLAIENSVDAIHGVYAGAVMHKQAA